MNWRIIEDAKALTPQHRSAAIAEVKRFCKSSSPGLLLERAVQAEYAKALKAVRAMGRGDKAADDAGAVMQGRLDVLEILLLPGLGMQDILESIEGE